MTQSQLERMQCKGIDKLGRNIHGWYVRNQGKHYLVNENQWQEVDAENIELIAK